MTTITAKARSYWKLFTVPYFFGFIGTYYFLAGADITTPVPPQREEFRNQVACQLAFTIWVPIFVASLLVDCCFCWCRGARLGVLQSPFAVSLIPGLACAALWWSLTDHTYGVHNSFAGVTDTYAKPVWWLAAECGVAGFFGFTVATFTYASLVPAAMDNLVKCFDKISKR